MKISNIKNNYNNGFTLTELIVVVAALTALAGFSIPNIFNSIKLNRIEEAKALMNSFASDCLSQFRISTNPSEFIEKATPDLLDNDRLSALQYKIDGDKNKCSHVAIVPINDNEKDLFAFDFRMSSEGRILKTATPSDNIKFLNSCKSWAGSNCGLSEAQKAEFARLEALAKAKASCIANYNNWLNEGSSGENVSWDSTNETCTRPVFAFEGIPVNSAEAIEKALEAKYGKACVEWRISKKDSISPNGNPETLDPECGGVQYWFHSGNEYTTQADWTEFDNKIKEQACIKDRSDALTLKKSGKYTYGPTPGPDPCGKLVWLCDGAEYNSEADYKATPCGAPPPPPPPPADPDHCKGFVGPPICPQNPAGPPLLPANAPECQCR